VLANGLAEVAVDGTDGTFALDGHRGLGRFVDGGDCGDTYNWCPPAEDTLVDRPDSVEVTVRERGPLRARVTVTARYRWPARCEGLDRRVGEVTHDVQALLELRAGERAVRVEVRFDNRSRDHRLRWHLPLPHPADRSRAECTFAVVERGLDAEGGPTEVGLPTFPAQRFVQAGGLTVVHDGVTEYELVDVRDGTAHELALMVARCTGMLSQMPMSTRPLPAGPLIPVEGAQLQGPVVRRFAVAVGDDVDPYALGDDVLVPLRVAAGGRAGRTGRTAASATAAAATAERDDTAAPRAAAGAGTAADRPVEPWLPPVGSALRVRGAEVSAVLRDGGTRVVRVFNPTDQPTTVTVEGGRGWLVDLRGRPLEPFEESFDLRPWGIATLALTD